MLIFLNSILDPNTVNNLPHAKTDSLTPILNIIFAVMGALGLLMLVIAGLRYTISQGDATRVADSKRMIIYTIVGLIVIALAATIVNFVLDKAS